MGRSDKPAAPASAGAKASACAAGASEPSVAECDKLIKAAQGNLDKARKELDKFVQEKPFSLAFRTACWFNYALGEDAEKAEKEERGRDIKSLAHFRAAAAAACRAMELAPTCTLASLAHVASASGVHRSSTREGAAEIQRAEHQLRRAVVEFKLSTCDTSVSYSQLLSWEKQILNLGLKKKKEDLEVLTALKEKAEEVMSAVVVKPSGGPAPVKNRALASDAPGAPRRGGGETLRSDRGSGLVFLDADVSDQELDNLLARLSGASREALPVSSATRAAAAPAASAPEPAATARGGRAKGAKASVGALLDQRAHTRDAEQRATSLEQRANELERVLAFWRSRVAETSEEQAVQQLLVVPADELLAFSASAGTSEQLMRPLSAIVSGEEKQLCWRFRDVTVDLRAELWVHLFELHKARSARSALWTEMSAFFPILDAEFLEFAEPTYDADISPEWSSLWVDKDELSMPADLTEQPPGETGVAGKAQHTLQARMLHMEQSDRADELELIVKEIMELQRLERLRAPGRSGECLIKKRIQELSADYASVVLAPPPASVSQLHAPESSLAACFPRCTVRHAELPSGDLTAVLVHDAYPAADTFVEWDFEPHKVPLPILALRTKLCAMLARHQGWPSWDMNKDEVSPYDVARSALYYGGNFTDLTETDKNEMCAIATKDVFDALCILCENGLLPTRIVRDLKRFLKPRVQAFDDTQRRVGQAIDEPLDQSVPPRLDMADIEVLELPDLLSVAYFVRRHWAANVVHTHQWQEQLMLHLGRPPIAFERRTLEDDSVAFHPSVALFGSCPQEGDCASSAENVLRWIFAQDAELSRGGLLSPEAADAAITSDMQRQMVDKLDYLKALADDRAELVERVQKLVPARVLILHRLASDGSVILDLGHAFGLIDAVIEVSEQILHIQRRLLFGLRSRLSGRATSMSNRAKRSGVESEAATAYLQAVNKHVLKLGEIEKQLVKNYNALLTVFQDALDKGKSGAINQEQILRILASLKCGALGHEICAHAQAELQSLDARLESEHEELLALRLKLCTLCRCDLRASVLKPVLGLLRERLLKEAAEHDRAAAAMTNKMAADGAAALLAEEEAAEKAEAEAIHRKSMIKRDKKKAAEALKKEAAAADAAEQQARLDAEAAVKKADEDAQEAARAAEKEEQKRLADAARAAALEARAREVAEAAEAQLIATEAEVAAERVRAAQRARKQEEERAMEQRLRELELKEAALEQESLSRLGASDAPARAAPRAYRPPSVARAPATQPSVLLPWMSAVPAAASEAALSPWPAMQSAPASYLPPAPFSYLPPAVPAAARPPPAAAQPVAGGAGLSNAAGEYNCFLNSIVQSLFRLSCFKQHLLKSTVPDAPEGSVLVLDVAIVNGLQQLFRALDGGAQLQREAGGPSASGRPVIAPTGLRLALAALLGAGGEGEGLLNEMADAVEILTQMYECFQRVSSHFRMGVQSPVSTMFILAVQEWVVCAECGVSSHALTYDTFFHLVHSTALREDRRRQGGGSLEDVLAGLMGSDTKGCDRDLRGCGRQMPVTFQLMRLPQVFTISLAWETAQASEVEVAETMQALSEVLHPSLVYRGGEQTDEPPRYELRALVCYYGSHYACFVRTEEAASQSRTWTRFDDTAVTLVGGWEALCSACSRGHLQPTVLFYERL